MATLEGQTIAASYEQLLHVDRDGGGNTSSLVSVKDGDNGTTFCISLTDASTDKAVLAVDGSHANGTEVQIDNSATDGDAFLSFQLSGTSKFTMGVDDGASDKFKIGTTAIGTGTMLALDTNSRMSMSNNDTSGTGGTDSTSSNTIFGYLAGDTLHGGDTGGYDNVLIGHKAGNAIEDADNNIAIGSESMLVHTDGSQNVCIGDNTMKDTDNAGDSGSSLTSGHNVFIGYNSGSGTWGAGATNQNVCVGSGTMQNVVTAAIGNVCIGYVAGKDITEGADNVLIGRLAGGDITTGDANICIGPTAGDALSGDDAGSNVFIGNDAGSAATTVGNAIAIGRGAMGGAAVVGTGGSNADFTVAVGREALYALTSGANNVAIGYQALDATLIQDNNTAVGFQALSAMVDPHDGHGGNTAVGSKAGAALVSSHQTTLVGFLAGGTGAMTGDNNHCFGVESGENLVGGSNNIFIGTQAGRACVSGADNTFIGISAGDSVTGSENTICGTSSDLDDAAHTNVSVLGYGVTPANDESNVAVIGNQNVTRVYGGSDSGATFYGAGQSWSDKRMKEDVKDIGLGLDFINKLEPIQYTKKQPADYDEEFKENFTWYGKSDKLSIPRIIEDSEKARIRPGFLAQDVLEVLEELGFSSNNSIVQIDKHTTQQSMDYAGMVVPLVKAVQELSAKVKALEDAQ